MIEIGTLNANFGINLLRQCHHLKVRPMNEMLFGYHFSMSSFLSVHGNWGKWSGFGVCSKTCGGGTKSRSRKCNNPSPAHGGRKCSGSSTQSAQCNTQHCPGRNGLF